jgi:hypothetical protein
MECVLDHGENRREAYAPLQRQIMLQLEAAAEKDFGASIAALDKKVMGLVVNKEITEVGAGYFEPGVNFFVDTDITNLPSVPNASQSLMSAEGGVVGSLTSGNTEVREPTSS